jgi:hypothetical protein
MHGIDGQQSLFEPELAQQSLDHRDFVGLFIGLSHHTLSQHRTYRRQANVVCDLPEPRELSCATEELRQRLVQLVEKGTFSRWPPISRRDVDSVTALVARVDRRDELQDRRRPRPGGKGSRRRPLRLARLPFPPGLDLCR